MPVFLIPLIMQLVMNLPALIKMAEEAFGGQPGSGAAKKELVMSGAGAIISTIATINKDAITPVQSEAVLGTLSKLTDTVVAGFNAANLFQKA